MNQEIKEKWIEALRSGKYQQGTGQLRCLSLYKEENDKFCCLGVLCDIINSTKWSKHDKIDYYFYENSDIHIPHFLRQYLGISCQHQDILMKQNDIENKSFNEIADWIKENL